MNITYCKTCEQFLGSYQKLVLCPINMTYLITNFILLDVYNTNNFFDALTHLCQFRFSFRLIISFWGKLTPLTYKIQNK